MPTEVPPAERSADPTAPPSPHGGAGDGPVLQLDVGANVVYPVHGVAEVIGHENRHIDGNTFTYVVLRIRGEIRSDDLTIHVQRERLEELGVRHAISLQRAGEVLEVLAVRDARLSPNWSRRFKNHQAKLRTGDVFECAEVVRNLALRHREKPLAAAEKAMLRRARSGLVAELAISWGITEDAASERVDDALGA